MTSSIRLRLFGGLGNQLFQYYAGLYFAHEFSCGLSLDVRWIENGFSQSNSDLRDFHLPSIVKTVTSESNGEINFIRERLKTRLSREIPLIGDLFGLEVPAQNGRYIERKNFQNRELRGYFQSPFYFQEVKSTLGKLELRKTNSIYSDMFTYLSASPFIAVHVRGADYLTNGNMYRILSNNYYARAIEMAVATTGIKRIIVFSDDSVYAHQLLSPISYLEFLDQSNLRASEAILLMSLADSLVIANSTFSFWSAMLSQSENIFAPNAWFNSEITDIELYPANWVKISNL